MPPRKLFCVIKFSRRGWGEVKIAFTRAGLRSAKEVAAELGPPSLEPHNTLKNNKILIKKQHYKILQQFYRNGKKCKSLISLDWIKVF